VILAITGGSGTLGSSIIQNQEALKSHGISKIRILSRDEQKQIHIQRTYQGTIPLDCYLADVTDFDRMQIGRASCRERVLR
jgi:FlaA1/EpsC-like NDP-sugar epimerase